MARKKTKAFGLAGFLAFAMALAWAQTPNLHPDTPQQATVQTVSFSFVLQGASPGHYSIAVDDTGKAAYRADDLAPSGTAGGASGEPYMVKVELTPATTLRIFEAARRANYFQGDFDYRGRRLANMGAKTLSYSQGTKQYQTGYNYSQNPAIMELTQIFERLGATLEFGRRLAYEHKYDRLGIEAELKSMIDQEKRGNLTDLQVDAPVLQAIADDTGVMNISRHRAQSLLDKIKASTSVDKPTAEPR